MVEKPKWVHNDERFAGYTQLLPFKEDDQFICKIATNTSQACKLIEDGFTFITGEYDDGSKIFRKPK